MKALLAVPFVVLAFTACSTGSPQAVTVTIGDRDCEVPPDLAAGNIDFTVNNTTGQRVMFTITENGGKAVGEVAVEPNSSGRFPARLDEDDTYHFQCGAVSGPDIKPGG